MGNFTMQIDFFGSKVRAETDTRLVNANDLVIAGNAWRIRNGLPAKILGDIISTNNYAAFKAATLKKTGLSDSDVVNVKRGRAGGTNVHLYLAIYIAEQISPEFHVEVIETFVEGKLLEFRNLGGTEFKKLNAAISSHFKSENKQKLYIDSAIALRDKILGPDAVAGDWDKADVSATHRRYEMESKLSEMIKLGFISDIDTLINTVKRL